MIRKIDNKILIKLINNKKHKKIFIIIKIIKI